MLVRNGIGPAFDGLALNLNSTPALAAHQMVMMARTLPAVTVNRLPIAVDEYVNVARIGPRDV